jgi:hypothetical protein
MTVSSTQYTAIPSYAGGLKLGLDKVFDTAFYEEGWQFEDVYDMDETEDGFVDDFQIQTPDAIDIVGEGGAYTRVDIEAVRTVRYTIFTLKTEMKITQEAEEDLKYKPLKNGAKALGVAMHRTIERLAAANLYNGFSSVTSPDGVSLFNTAHALANPLGGHPTTMSNRSQLRLNAVNLGTRRVAGRKQLDEHGSPSPAKFNQLIVGPDLMYVAEQITEGKEEPFTANRNVNVTQRGIKTYVLDYLQEAPQFATAMWLLRDSKLAKNRCIWRKKPESSIAIDGPTGDPLYRQRCRLVFGHSDYRGIDGNTGELG